MKGFPTQSEYLGKLGLSSSSSKKETEEAKRTYRKLYRKEYRKRKKAEEIRFTMRLRKEIYDRFKQEAKEHRLSLNQYLIQSAEAYVDENYLYPDKEARQQIIREVMRMRGHIHEIIHKLHEHLRYKSTQGDFDETMKNLAKIMVGYELLLERVGKLEHMITSYTTTAPPDLLGLSWEELRNDKKKLKHLIQFLLEHLDNQAHS